MSGEAAFVRNKSRWAVTWSLLNLQQIADVPCAMTMGRPLEGRTAIVCGAGYAMTRNGEHLRAAQERGAVILAVNSAAPVLRGYGVTPDVIVARESIDSSAEIRASEAPLVCLDACAHPEMWRAAEGRLAWFLPGYPRHFRIAQRLGVRPLFGGPAAFTSAVALALEWGAARIVIAGAGFGMETVDGELVPYHPAAPRGALRGRLDADAVEFTGNDADDERVIASGQRPQPSRCGYVLVPAHDNGSWLPALDPLAEEREWLETQAIRHGHRVTLRNATEGGAGVVGWRNVTLASEVEALEGGEPVVFAGHAPAREREVAAMVRDLRAEAETLRTMTGHVLAPSGARLRAIAQTPGIVHGAPLAECLAAYRLVDAHETEPLAQCRTTYQALREAAGEALDVLRGAP